MRRKEGGGRKEEEEERRGEEREVPQQKQKPHNTMWGTSVTVPVQSAEGNSCIGESNRHHPFSYNSYKHPVGNTSSPCHDVRGHFPKVAGIC